MHKRLSVWRVTVSAGLVLLLAALAQAGWPAPDQEPVWPIVLAQNSPVVTPTSPSSPLPSPTPPLPPPAEPTPTPVPITEVFRPVPSTGGQRLLGAPAILWEVGLGLVLIGLGLAWRRMR